jgi:hypothetical protein
MGPQHEVWVMLAADGPVLVDSPVSTAPAEKCTVSAATHKVDRRARLKPPETHVEYEVSIGELEEVPFNK